MLKMKIRICPARIFLIMKSMLSKHKKKLSRTRQIFKLPRLSSARVGDDGYEEVGSLDFCFLLHKLGNMRPLVVSSIVDE